jgi:hypothetical protein
MDSESLNNFRKETSKDIRQHRDFIFYLLSIPRQNEKAEA